VRPSNPNNPNQADIIDTFNEKLSYDKNGNILSLVRNGGRESQTTVPVMDNLVYGYDTNDKNKLTKVTDATANTDGFKDGADTTIEYGYDLNGNMVRDDNKGISSITYNHLNLPTKLVFNNDSNTKIEYLYTATGQKIQKNVYQYRPQITATLEPAPAIVTDYLGGFQYVDEGLQFFPTAEGYVKYTESATNPFDYVFNYTDHLGNIRLSYAVNPATGLLKKMEENNYYPFGLKHGSYNTEEIIIAPRPIGGPDTGKFMKQRERPITDISEFPTQNPTLVPEFFSGYNYKFQNKEWQDELSLNLYDFGGRLYDPATVRTTTHDPLAEKFYDLSPQSFLNNNPLRFTDPTGMAPDDWIKRNGKIVWDEKVTSATDKDLQKGDEYLGKAVVVFNGSRDEKLGKGDNLFGAGAKLADVTVYGPDGADDVKTYEGFSMSSDSKKFGAIADGTYEFNYDTAGKSGKLKSHWAIENRGNVTALDGFNPNPNASTDRRFKNGIFIHTSNQSGFAGSYNNGKNGISEGCLLIVPSLYNKEGASTNNGWNQFNQQLQDVKKGVLQIIRK